MQWDQIGAVDAVLGIWLAWAMFNGFRKGLIIKVASIVALVLGIYAGFHFSSFAAEWLNQQFDWSTRTTEVCLWSDLPWGGNGGAFHCQALGKNR